MDSCEWDIIILKPTSVFLSFLADQLPDVDLPKLSLLQTDTTAYSIRKQDCEEATLDEIEVHFAPIFRHEINRRLGAHACRDVHPTFLDFLCCFKFEVHSHMILMESSIRECHQLLAVRPRAVLLKWMKSNPDDGDEAVITLERVSVSNLVENATVILKNFKQLSEVKPFMQDYYRPIFQAEMWRMCESEDHWPAVNSFQDFHRYFSVEIHTQLIHF